MAGGRLLRRGRPRADRGPRRLLPRRPDPDPPVGRERGGLERGGRLRRPGLARPRRLFRARRLLGRAPRHPVGGVALDRAGGRRRPRHRVRLHPGLPEQSPPRPLLRAGDDRVLPGAADRGEPLARLHLGVGGHPGSLPRRLLDAGHRGQAGLGLPRPRPGRPALSGPALPRALAPRLPARGGARGRGRGALARRPGPPPQGRRHRGQRRAHRRVRHALGPVRRLRGPLLRLLGGPVDPLLPGRDTRRHRDAPRAIPRRRPHHDAGDVAARPLRRHRRRSRRDLPDHLRRRAHRHGALRAARPGAVDRRPAAPAPRLGPTA